MKPDGPDAGAPSPALPAPAAAPAGDSAIETAVFALLEQRRTADATVCPSEVARVLTPGDWRPLMPHVRRVAAALAADGRLRVTRGGVDVDAESPGGPIRLGRPPNRRFLNQRGR